MIGKPVRVTRVGGEVLNLAAAEIRNDSLFGMRVYATQNPYVALPLSEVTRVETEETSVTIPAILGIGALVVFWQYVVLPALYS